MNLHLGCQEIDLTMKAPPPHIAVEILEKRVGVVGLEDRVDVVTALEKLHERGLASADIPGDGNVGAVHEPMKSDRNGLETRSSPIVVGPMWPG